MGGALLVFSFLLLVSGVLSGVEKRKVSAVFGFDQLLFSFDLPFRQTLLPTPLIKQTTSNPAARGNAIWADIGPLVQ